MLAWKARALWRRFRIFLSQFLSFLKLAALALISIFLCLCFVSSFRQALYESSSNLLLKLGFVLEELVVEGRCNTQEQEVYSFIEYPSGTPIWHIDPNAILQRVKKGVWVKRCCVSRRLPNAICVTIIERVPIAIWQNNYKHYLIDSEGEIICLGAGVRDFAYLPRIVGKGGNVYAKKLLEDISSNPDLASKVEVAIRCGERRWDIYLGGILIKMPQGDILKAWKYLSDLDSKQALFGQKIKSIDMRSEEKFYIEYQDSPS